MNTTTTEPTTGTAAAQPASGDEFVPLLLAAKTPNGLAEFFSDERTPAIGQQLELHVYEVSATAVKVRFTARRPRALASPRWAVVELMGHRRIAGRVSEEQVLGTTMCRVDVPEVAVDDYAGKPIGSAPTARTIAAHSRSFSAAAIYAVSWCSEEEAIEAAARIGHDPAQTRQA